MEEYRTYVFEKSKKKTRKRFLYNLSIVAGILLILYLTFVGVLGIGFSFIGAIALIAVLIKMKIYDDKYMGITAYGNRKEKFYIREDSFLVGDTSIPYSELKDLVIYVDEYEGMPRELFGVHHGGNNEITFEHNGNKMSINYIIKSRDDFKKVEKLIEKIENQQLTMNSK